MSEARPATHARQYAESPQKTDADGTRHWLTLAANFVTVVSQASTGAVLARSNPDEWDRSGRRSGWHACRNERQQSDHRAAGREPNPRPQIGNRGAGILKQGSGPGRGCGKRCNLCRWGSRSGAADVVARPGRRFPATPLRPEQYRKSRPKPSKNASVPINKPHDQRLRSMDVAARREKAQPPFARGFRASLTESERRVRSPPSISLVVRQDVLARRRA